MFFLFDRIIETRIEYFQDINKFIHSINYLNSF